MHNILVMKKKCRVMENNINFFSPYFCSLVLLKLSDFIAPPQPPASLDIAW